MDLQLKNKVVIITGGSKGIGSGISMCLANEGAIPVILSKSEMSTDFEKELSRISATYGFYKINLNNTSEIKSIVDDVALKYGHIFAVVNNAGINDNKDLESTNWHDFEESIHQNLTHYYELVHSALPYLEKVDNANILNISSKTALTGQGNTSPYAAAKGAILALTREWAAALAKNNIRSNAIVVSECFTPLYEKWIKSFGDEAQQKRQLKKIENKIPLYQRMTTIKEIADTSAFILSPRSSHTTGQWLFVDGGYVHLDRALTD